MALFDQRRSLCKRANELLAMYKASPQNLTDEGKAELIDLLAKKYHTAHPLEGRISEICELVMGSLAVTEASDQPPEYEKITAALTEVQNYINFYSPEEQKHIDRIRWQRAAIAQETNKMAADTRVEFTEILNSAGLGPVSVNMLAHASNELQGKILKAVDEFAEDHMKARSGSSELFIHLSVFCLNVIKSYLIIQEHVIDEANVRYGKVMDLNLTLGRSTGWQPAIKFGVFGDGSVNNSAD